MGACVGYQTALRDRRVVNFVGDGSFQVTAVVSSTILRSMRLSLIQHTGCNFQTG